MSPLPTVSANNSSARQAFRENWPIFYDLVEDFPDFKLAPGLSSPEIKELEKSLEFSFPQSLKKFLLATSACLMNGLSIRADQFGTILLPESEGLILGYLNLGNAADRLLMLPGEDSIYYLEQHNGAITKIAPDFDALFNTVLPRRLYS